MEYRNTSASGSQLREALGKPEEVTEKIRLNRTVDPSAIINQIADVSGKTLHAQCKYGRTVVNY